jgi:glycerophosphoryl diester phosphodiesterase
MIACGLMALAGLAGCNSNGSKNVEMVERPDFTIHGHRGARGLMPENSMEGFILALSLGIDVLEMDVVVTADSQIVVSHEPWVSAAICLDSAERPIAADAQLDLNIYRMTYAQVRSYDCGSLPNPDFPLQQRLPTYKPLLTDVIRNIEKKRSELGLAPLLYNIESKCSPEGDGTYHPAPAVFCRLLLKAIDQVNARKMCIIQSFDMRTLREMRSLAPELPLALLVADPKSARAETDSLGFVPNIYSPDYHGLTEELVSEAHGLGMKVVPWTINEESDMTDMLELGVDGLITDYPDLAVTLRQ